MCWFQRLLSRVRANSEGFVEPLRHASGVCIDGEKMPTLKQQSQAVNRELQLLEMAQLDQARHLKLTQSLSGFRKKLHARAHTLDVKQRQHILRSYHPPFDPDSFRRRTSTQCSWFYPFPAGRLSFASQECTRMRRCF
jgi:hypothetical protein